MIPALNEMLGLPLTTDAAEIAHAADMHSDTLFDLASGGDATARRMLVELQFAYRVWAYAGNRNAGAPAGRDGI